jgi:hypothetical protein
VSRTSRSRSRRLSSSTGVCFVFIQINGSFVFIDLFLASKTKLTPPHGRWGGAAECCRGGW